MALGMNIQQDYLGGPQYLIVPTPGCVPVGDPSCETRQRVIGTTEGGGVVSEAPSDKPWLAWVPMLTTFNNDGTAYQPYTSGIPTTLEGGSVVKWNPTDMQALAYLESQPGAGAMEAYQERTCSPLWSNVFGCKEGNQIWIPNETIAKHETFFGKLKSLFGAESYQAESNINPLVFVGVGSALILGCILVGNA
jgi:hypothetical protein